MGLGRSDAVVIAESVGDPARFGELYGRHVRRVAEYLARRVGSELAEDLTAEVFVRAFRGRAAFRAEHDSALPWLFGIASHLVGDHRRAERRRLVALQRLMSEAPSSTDDRIGLLTPELVVRLRRLPAGHRDALLLVVWGELSYEEAASALGVSVGTVRSRIARARQRLSRDLAGDAPGTALGGHPGAMTEGDWNA
jgi:RNA polymerase sigma-70 factor (ECF subfamily)